MSYDCSFLYLGGFTVPNKVKNHVVDQSFGKLRLELLKISLDNTRVIYIYISKYS